MNKELEILRYLSKLCADCDKDLSCGCCYDCIVFKMNKVIKENIWN